MAAHVHPQRPLLPPQGAPSLARLPGSDSILELVHLVRDARRFLHERYERHGPVFLSRLVQPVVFAIGDEARDSAAATERARLPFGAGYTGTAVDRLFEPGIARLERDEASRARDVLELEAGRLAVAESGGRAHRIWARAAERLAHGRGVDVHELAGRTTFDVAADALLGGATSEVMDASRPLLERLVQGLMAPVNFRVPFGKLDRALRARQPLRDAVRPLVEQARREPPRGLVGRLAHQRDEAGRWLDLDAVVDHLLLLCWAAYDDTSSAAAWVLHTLARRPDWQVRLRDELAAHVRGDPGLIASSEYLRDLRHFLLEIERLYPSALFYPRVTMDALTIAGRLVPGGTMVCYSPYMSHRDARMFPHPDAFEPDRWDPERNPLSPPESALDGLGGAARTRVGRDLARLQLGVMVHAVLGRYALRPDPTCRPTVQGVPVHHPLGSRVRFERI